MSRRRLVLALAFAAGAFALGTRYALVERNTLWALDVRSGRASWMQDITDAPPTEAVAAHNGVLYRVGLQKGLEHRVTIDAFDAATGAQRWTRTLDGRVLHEKNTAVYAAADALVVNSLPIRGAFAPTLDAFAAQDGSPRGSLALDGWRWIDPAAPGAARLHLFDDSGAISAVDLTAGALTTAVPFGGPVDALGRNGETIIASPDAVYAFYQDRYVLIPAGAGAPVTLPITRASLFATPHLVLGLDAANYIVALDATTGAHRWRQTLPPAVVSAGAPSLSAAAASEAGAMVMLEPAQDSDLYQLIAFDAQGATRWQAAIPRNGLDYPRRLYITDDVLFSRVDDTLRAYRVSSGELLWTRTFDTLYSTDAFDASTGRFAATGYAPRWRQWLFYFGIQPGI